MIRLLTAILACAALTACAIAPPQTAEQADASACTAQGDAIYNASTLDQQARTSQNGLLFGATPTHVFDAERLGAEHERQSAITNCENNGNTATPDGLPAPAAPPPHIVGTP
jgi:hypothetical protein